MVGVVEYGILEELLFAMLKFSTGVRPFTRIVDRSATDYFDAESVQQRMTQQRRVFTRNAGKLTVE